MRGSAKVPGLDVRVDDRLGIAVNVAGRQPVEDPAGVSSRDLELRHEAHIKEDHPFPASLVLGGLRVTQGTEQDATEPDRTS